MKKIISTFLVIAHAISLNGVSNADKLIQFKETEARHRKEMIDIVKGQEAAHMDIEKKFHEKKLGLEASHMMEWTKLENRAIENLKKSKNEKDNDVAFGKELNDSLALYKQQKKEWMDFGTSREKEESSHWEKFHKQMAKTSKKHAEELAVFEK